MSLIFVIPDRLGEPLCIAFYSTQVRAIIAAYIHREIVGTVFPPLLETQAA